MTITHYSFGKIIIQGRTYTSDVIIYPDRVDPTWWREEGHRLQPQDLAGVAAAQPEAVVIGTGHLGAMKVTSQARAFLESKGAEVHIARTGQAAALFNKIQAEKRTVACLHLTC